MPVVDAPSLSLARNQALMSGSTRHVPIAVRPAVVGKAGQCTGGFVSTKCGGVSWKLRADFAAELLPSLQSAAAGPERDGEIETVKTGPHRTVYRLRASADEYYLKHFRTYHWKGLLVNLVRPTKAESEWRAALRIAELGLPTFEPVALGIARRGGLVADSYLVSRGIHDAVPLDEFATQELRPAVASASVGEEAVRRAELRQALTIAVGELTARLHLAGVEHADFHAANVLVRLEPDGRPRLWLIDLHRVYFRSRLSEDRRYRNLAFLHQFFVGKSTRADRLRFYLAYRRVWQKGSATTRRELSAGHGVAQFARVRAGDGVLNSGEFSYSRNASDLAGRPSFDRDEIALLEKYLAIGAQRGWRRADRAWRRGNRHVKKLDGKDGRCRGLAGLNLAWLKELRNDPERLFAGGSLVWHKQTAKHRIAEVELPDELAAFRGKAFFKCIERFGLWRNWLAQFRDSPVRKAWEYGHALLRRQIDTPRPILCVEQCPTQPRRSYLLTEAVPETTTASEFLDRDWPGMPPEVQIRWLRCHGRRLADQMRRLHDSGFDHRDLKFSNLLVSFGEEDPRIWFLDLDGMRTWRHLPEQRAVQNLARINVSTTAHALGSKSDRLRFLKCYLGQQRARDWKSWWRRIEETSLRKLDMNNRRGRAIH